MKKCLLYAKNAFEWMNELFHTQVPNPLWYWYAPSLVWNIEIKYVDF
jgi:hypothetical protein